MNQMNLQVHDILFSNAYCKQLLKNDKIEEAKTYLRNFFFCYNTELFYFNGEDFNLYSKTDIPKLVSKDLIKYEDKQLLFSAFDYFKTPDFMDIKYEPTIDFTKPRRFSTLKYIQGIPITKHFVNMAKPYNVNKFKNINYETTKPKLDLIYNHILKVWCSDNEPLYEYVLNFIACTFGGRKLRKALFIQSIERTGKGIIIDLIMNILGDASIKNSSVCDILDWTKSFEGRVFINFDELPTDGSNFKSIGDSLKRLITEPTFDCKQKGQTSYPQKNTFNIIITSNNDAVHLTQSNHERYVVLDVSECMKGNTKYFEQLHNATKDEDVQTLFYNEMMKRFVNLKWNEDIVPETKAKQTKMIEALPQLYKWIKKVYILDSKDMNLRTNDFFELYENQTKDKTSKQKLGALLKKIGIEPIKVKKDGDQFYVYRRTHDELLKSYQANKWMDDLVDVIDKKTNIDDAEYERGIDKSDQSIPQPDYKTLYEHSQTQINELLNHIKALEEIKNYIKVIKKTNNLTLKKHKQNDFKFENLKQSVQQGLDIINKVTTKPKVINNSSHYSEKMADYSKANKTIIDEDDFLDFD